MRAFAHLRRALPLAILAMLLAPPAAALASPPVQSRFTVDDSSSRPNLAAICGFADVIETDQGNGVLSFHFDQTGAVVLELDHWHLTTTLVNPANGASVTYLLRQTQRWVTNADGSITVDVTGASLKATAPGQGLVGARIGHFVLSISPSGDATVALVGGQDSAEAFFGSPGAPGTLCALLA